MKVSVSLGATLSLGNYNTARASIVFEDDISEQELLIPDQFDSDGKPLLLGHETRSVLATRLADALYQQVENKLIEKIAAFITRLENEQMV